VTTTADVTVDDVQPRPVVELRVLEPFRGVELAVRAGGVVEDLGEDPHHVLVVVEHLVVVARAPEVPLDEDGVGRVHHHLPDVVVVEEGREGPVARQVPVGALGDEVRVAQVVGMEAATVVERPARDLVGDERAQLVLAGAGAGHVQGDVLGPFLHCPLDLLERPQLALHPDPLRPAPPPGERLGTSQHPEGAGATGPSGAPDP